MNSSTAYQRGIFNKASDFSKNLNGQFERNDVNELLTQEENRKKREDENNDSLKTHRVLSMNKIEGIDDGGSRETF